MQRVSLRMILVGAAVALVAALPVEPARAAVSIAPAFVEVRLDKGRPSGEFMITNVGEEDERYRVNSLHFTFTEKGSLQKIPPDAQSMAAWIIFNPKEFTLPPQKRRKIRFAIVPRGALRTGEYWAAMELESLNTVTAKSKDNAGREFKIEVISTILVPMFGQVGNIRYGAKLEETYVKPSPNGPVIESMVVNSGNGRLVLQGSYEITNGDGKEVSTGFFGKTYVLAGMDRLFEATPKEALAEGSYTLRVKYSAPQLEAPLEQEIQFEWKPVLPPAEEKEAPEAASPAGPLPAPADAS